MIPAAAVVGELGAVIKSGRIVRESFDADGNAEIVYEVSSPGLKARVTGAK